MRWILSRHLPLVHFLPFYTEWPIRGKLSFYRTGPVFGHSPLRRKPAKIGSAGGWGSRENISPLPTKWPIWPKPPGYSSASANGGPKKVTAINTGWLCAAALRGDAGVKGKASARLSCYAMIGLVRGKYDRWRYT